MPPPTTEIDDNGALVVVAAPAAWLGPADSATFDVAPGPPFAVRVATTPPATVVSEVGLPTVLVRIEDAGGNLAATVPVDSSPSGGALAALVSTAALTSNPAGGTVVAGGSAAVVDGVATHVGLAVDQAQACVVSCPSYSG